MANLKLRVKALEIIANPEKPWFCIDIVNEPAPDEWEQITSAHIDGREVYIFKQDATLGVWLAGVNDIYWSNGNGNA